MLNILALHGVHDRAAEMAANTKRLRDELADIATLHYADGPPDGPSNSRPWWILDHDLEIDSRVDRWNETVAWWSEELSKNRYDGIIGFSQGSAMAALLVSMIAHPERVPGFSPSLQQSIKFVIFCSGFISHLSPHKEIYGIPDDLFTFHIVGENDTVVPPGRSIELQKMCKNSVLKRHNEWHVVPVDRDWPQVMKDFIVDAVKN